MARFGGPAEFDPSLRACDARGAAAGLPGLFFRFGSNGCLTLSRGQWLLLSPQVRYHHLGRQRTSCCQ